MLLAGRYRLERLLGRGGMGEVWRAVDVILDRPVAVKLLLDPGHGSGAAERFRTEARTAARLNHPQVVSVYDFGCDGDRFYLVMELVTGRSLAEELAVGGPLSPRRAAAVGAQAAEGLAVAHERGVVHQDVKPENLLLTTDGTVKISDFGIARLTDGAAAARTGDEALVGTTPYLAPERVLGEQAGPASDVYALGCVLYTLLTGRGPHPGGHPPGGGGHHPPPAVSGAGGPGAAGGAGTTGTAGGASEAAFASGAGRSGAAGAASADVSSDAESSWFTR
ncbi:serine/threonine-protein kinase [Streptomyces sp. NPDC059506]|uniref:serine/threonine-protein kinase n=1 Tax=Streptomyces sp. NPDC059506 TaxID=3347751 RepID=UPI00369FEF9E